MNDLEEASSQEVLESIQSVIMFVHRHKNPAFIPFYAIFFSVNTSPQALVPRLPRLQLLQCFIDIFRLVT